MKKTIIIPLTIMTLAATACQQGGSSEENPLLTTPATPYGAPQFDKIKTEHYEPAFDVALAEARADIEAIARNPEPPTFDNTIVALERSGNRLNSVATIFFALQSAETSDEMDAIAERLQPKLVEYSNDIYLDPVIFQRVKTVYDNRADYGLDIQDSMLLDRTYKSFVRGGAGLDEAGKERYRAITNELATLSLKFEQNVLAATNAFTLNIPAADSAKVAELPDFVRESMADEAAARGEEGWTVTLQMASYGPFMTYSSDRELKEKLWRAYNTRGIGENDNRDIAKRIAELRLELAGLFGYPNYAAYVLEEKMAGNEATVDAFIDELLTATKGRALEEVAELQRYAVASGLYGAGFELMPWDWSYVSEKYKNDRYAVSNEEIKPYLELESVKQGIFSLAEKLYGITFVPNKGDSRLSPRCGGLRSTRGRRKLYGHHLHGFLPACHQTRRRMDDQLPADVHRSRRNRSTPDCDALRQLHQTHLLDTVAADLRRVRNFPTRIRPLSPRPLRGRKIRIPHGDVRVPGLRRTALADNGELGDAERVPRPVRRALQKAVKRCRRNSSTR